MTESLLHDADLETVDALAEGLRVRSRERRVLPRVEAVGPGDYFQEQSVVCHGGGHRPGVVERQLNRHDPGVRDKPMGRLHAVDAAEGGRNAYGSALIATECHIHLAGGHERGGPR